jgi:GH25 family lysozyme M1 (1,4-beta-N-acetylmuramidase)
MKSFKFWRQALACAAALFISVAAQTAQAETTFQRPWLAKHRALVLDAYENNEIDLVEIATNKRIAGFIHKGSDGLPPVYSCKTATNATEAELCKKTWKVYAVSKQLYHTRKALAKALGMKWGVYHLGRANNPIDQANHLIDFADPQPDELIAIDIEDVDPQFMSLKDAEEFARHIKRRLNRYPVLYVNGSVAKHIGLNRDEYPLLSRLPLWYARYKPEIGEHFPKGNWDNYALWQFASQVNCNKRACPYRINGAGNDIDVNVSDMSVAELQKAWPMDKLVDVKDPQSSKDFSEYLMATLRRLLPKATEPRQVVEQILASANTLKPRPQLHTIPAFGIDRITTASVAYNYSPRVRD